MPKKNPKSNARLAKNKKQRESKNLALIEKEITEISRKLGVDDCASKGESIELCKKFIQKPGIPLAQRYVLIVNLSSAYQDLGQHQDALAILGQIDSNKLNTMEPALKQFVNLKRAISLSAITNYKDAIQLFDELIKNLSQEKKDFELRQMIFIEAGKAYYLKGDLGKSIELWEGLLVEFGDKEKKDFPDSYSSLISNLGFSYMKANDKATKEKGRIMVDEGTEIKLRMGNLRGLATNYCNLGLHYMQEKNFQLALSYFWRDLKFTRKIGDKKGFGDTLNNFGLLYLILRQVKKARNSLREALVVAEEISDLSLEKKTRQNSDALARAAKTMAIKKIKFDNKALCACDSGKLYDECCGKADSEPIDLPWDKFGISEDLLEIRQNVEQAGLEYSRLDYILRETESSKIRLAWTALNVNNGLFEVSELPDMCNIFLNSANSLIQDVLNDSNITQNAIACLVLSICSVESFINQVAYHVKETYDRGGKCPPDYPEALKEDVMNFQRTTRLEDKWMLLGKYLCKNNWPPEPSIWKQFCDLISIRNEFVHFKSMNYDQIVPKQKQRNNILKKLPNDVIEENQFDDNITHSWPFQLFNQKFAKYSIKVAQMVIKAFKEGYWKARMEKSA